MLSFYLTLTVIIVIPQKTPLFLSFFILYQLSTDKWRKSKLPAEKKINLTLKATWRPNGHQIACFLKFTRSITVLSCRKTIIAVSLVKFHVNKSVSP